jgi:hypothetical protein
LAQRIIVYWAAVSLGPLLIGGGLFLTSYAVSASLGLLPSGGWFAQWVLGVLPLGLTTLAFTLLFLVLVIRPWGLLGRPQGAVRNAAELEAPLRAIVEAFGPSRVFWGSDVTRLPGTYRNCVLHFTEQLPWLDRAALESIMGGALASWLRW